MDLNILTVLWVYILSSGLMIQGKPPGHSLQDAQSEQAWDAWLLIDSQSQRSDTDYEDSSTAVRRITPKSIFTVRPFSPEYLPPCADGYQSDSMGRCVKFVKIDQSSHLDFLIQKLNTMYNFEDEDEDYENDSGEQKGGPLQVNIPLEGSALSEISTSHNDTKVAILVTPSTNGPFDAADFELNLVKNGSIFLNMSSVGESSKVNDTPPVKDVTENRNDTYILTNGDFSMLTHNNEKNTSELNITANSSVTLPVIDLVFPEVNNGTFLKRDDSKVNEKQEDVDSNNEIQTMNFNGTENSVSITESDIQVTEINSDSSDTEVTSFGITLTQNETITEDKTAINKTDDVLVDNVSIGENKHSIHDIIVAEKLSTNETILNTTLVVSNQTDHLSYQDEVVDIVEMQHNITNSSQIVSSLDNSKNGTIEINTSQPKINDTNLKESEQTDITTYKPTKTIRPQTIPHHLYLDRLPAEITKPQPNINPAESNLQNQQVEDATVEKRPIIRFPDFNHRNRDKNMYTWDPNYGYRHNNRPLYLPQSENGKAPVTSRYASEGRIRIHRDSYYREILPEDWTRIFSSKKLNT